MTLLDLQKLFNTDEKCREALTKMRWPNGVECPHCHSKQVTWIKSRNQFDCAECEYHFSVTAGTIFNDSHLPLTTWFTAVLLLIEARKGFSANQMKRTIGVSYKTAWYLCHRIRAAMVEASQPKLTGTVEVDETFIGGKKPMERKREKDIVVGIRQRDGALRFFKASDLKQETLYKIVAENVDKTVDVIVTDEFSSYNFDLTQYKGKHKTIRHKDKIYVQGEVHTNTVESAFSLLKRGIVGTWHRLSAKHLPAYLNEMTFRFNRRKNADLFVDTLRHMVTAPVLTFEKLTA